MLLVETEAFLKGPGIEEFSPRCWCFGEGSAPVRGGTESKEMMLLGVHLGINRDTTLPFFFISSHHGPSHTSHHGALPEQRGHGQIRYWIIVTETD